jgi:hypothetical protein
MVMGRGHRREHPNQHCVLLLRKKNWEKKRRGKNTGIKSTGKKVVVLQGCPRPITFYELALSLVICPFPAIVFSG